MCSALCSGGIIESSGECPTDWMATGLTFCGLHCNVSPLNVSQAEDFCALASRWVSRKRLKSLNKNTPDSSKRFVLGSLNICSSSNQTTGNVAVLRPDWLSKGVIICC